MTRSAGEPVPTCPSEAARRRAIEQAAGVSAEQDRRHAEWADWDAERTERILDDEPG